MEDLHNEHLAAHHAEVQRHRGGHRPGPLGDPLPHIPARRPRASFARNGSNGARRRAAANDGSRNGSAAPPPADGRQLTFGDVGVEERRDEL